MLRLPFLFLFMATLVGADAQAEYLQVLDEPVIIRNKQGDIAYSFQNGEFFKADITFATTPAGITKKLSVWSNGERLSAEVPEKDFSKTLTDFKTKLPTDHLAYLDLDNSQVTTVFNEPGLTWRDCKEETIDTPDSKCIGWPHNDAEITILDSKMMPITDAYTGERRFQNYYYVKYKYVSRKEQKPQEGKGWLSSEFVSVAPVKIAQPKIIPTPLPPKPEAKPPDCPPKAPEQPPVPDAGKWASIGAAVEKLAKSKSVDAAYAAVRNNAGRCLTKPPNSTPNLAAKTSAFKTIFAPQSETFATPVVAQKIPKANGTPMTAKDFVAIDALARTIYGEMAVCWGKGAHYLQAVGAVVQNRATAVQNHHSSGAMFAGRNPDPRFHPVSQVIEYPSQFSAWNARINGKPNPSLKHVLCPPAPGNNPFWTGKAPSKNEMAIWDQALRIATEVVVDADAFKRNTADVKQLYYTSGLGFFKKGFTRENAQVNGFNLNSSRCIELWKSPEINEQQIAKLKPAQ